MWQHNNSPPPHTGQQAASMDITKLVVEDGGACQTSLPIHFLVEIHEGVRLSREAADKRRSPVANH